jgi:hypothetical protein
MSHITAASQAQDVAISTAVTVWLAKDRTLAANQATTGILRSAVI